MISFLYALHDQLRVVIPCVLLIIGTALYGISRRHRLTTVERVKNRQMTEIDARRALAFVRYSGPMLTGLGLALLIFACWNSTQ